MLLRTLTVAAIAAVAAFQVPALFSSAAPAASRAGSTAIPVDSTPAQQTAAIPTNGQMDLKAGVDGHFRGTFRINGKTVDGLVDTGATFVAISTSTAKRLGFSGNSLRYKYAVGTANGPTMAAHVTLDRIEIGGIRVRDVDAFVLKDEALGTTLIGMSFLKKLATYGVEGDTLSLKE